MKKIVSHFFPLTTKVASEKNGLLEVTWYNGKKILDSANANYSYGSLQRILKFGLTKIDLSRVDDVLLLGLGGGCVIQTLRQDFNFTKKITAVEFDRTVIELAREEFNISSFNNVEIIYADAFHFALDIAATYSLIIIDLFIDNKVPDLFYSMKFWERISTICAPGGSFLFNAEVTSARTKNPNQLLLDLAPGFRIDKFENVENSNTLLIGKKIASA